MISAGNISCLNQNSNRMTKAASNSPPIAEDQTREHEHTPTPKETARELRRLDLLEREWYNVQSFLGNDLFILYFMLGSRETGKSYSVTKCFVNQFKRYHRPFYWLRLSDTSQKKLLKNNAEKLVDPDIRRAYHLDLVTVGDAVYNVTKRNKKGGIIKKELMARVLSLATYYNDKGSGLFDKDFLDDSRMYYNICLDEMNREAAEANRFDILSAFVGEVENLIRSTKHRVRIICIGNTLQEASDLLCGLNFVPEQFGRFKLIRNKKLLSEFLRLSEKKHLSPEEKKRMEYLKTVDYGKRAIIENMPPNNAYKRRRKGTISDILTPQASNYTNEITVDSTLVNKSRLYSPQYVIKFSKSKENWFTVWNNNIIAKYNGEQCTTIAMRPYIDETFTQERRDLVFELFDNRAYQFHNLVAFKYFQKELQQLKPRK